MITIRVNDYDHHEQLHRQRDQWDVTVDGTRVATFRSFRQSKAFIGAIEQDLGYPCRAGTQMANFHRYYRKKYSPRDINV